MFYHNKRRRLFVDRPVQVALILRATLYWVMCLVAQLLMVFVFAVITSPQDVYSNESHLWWHFQLAVLAAIVLLPLILLDVLKLSHRWVGPVFRLRMSLQALSKGKSISPICFREHDFWQDLAGDLNVVAAELDRQRSEALDAPGAAAESEPAEAAVN